MFEEFQFHLDNLETNLLAYDEWSELLCFVERECKYIKVLNDI